MEGGVVMSMPPAKWLLAVALAAVLLKGVLEALIGMTAILAGLLCGLLAILLNLMAASLEGLEARLPSTSTLVGLPNQTPGKPEKASSNITKKSSPLPSTLHKSLPPGARPALY